MILPTWVFWLALMAMGVGLLGVVLPLLPGVGFIWLVVLAYALAEQFTTIDPITFTFLTILGATGFSANLWMSHLGAKVGGASVWSLVAGLLVGAIGAIVGLAFLAIGAVPSAIIGTIVGVFLAEWYQRRNWREALKASGGWLIGCTLSSGVQFLIGVLMITVFVWQVQRG